jgi:hypothetical protein
LNAEIDASSGKLFFENSCSAGVSYACARNFLGFDGKGFGALAAGKINSRPAVDLAIARESAPVDSHSALRLSHRLQPVVWMKKKSRL